MNNEAIAFFSEIASDSSFLHQLKIFLSDSVIRTAPLSFPQPYPVSQWDVL